MLTIDADAHVIESEQTWETLDGAERKYKPVPISTEIDGRPRQFWLIDGALHSRRQNIGRDTPEASREMADVPARLRHMDELQVDVQVLYPSLFLHPLTHSPAVELALCRGYNEWLAEIWRRGDGRLRWAYVPPIMSVDQAASQLGWAKDNGACAIFMRGLECERLLSDPYFFPLYAAAEEVGLAIGIHAGSGSYTQYDFFGGEAGLLKNKMPVFGAFHALLFGDVPARFPKLRFGFVEASAQWVPYVLHDLTVRLRNTRIDSNRQAREIGRDALAANRFYVACQTDDDLCYVLEYAGENNLMIGTDYGHGDTSSELEALRRLRVDSDVPAEVIDKILGNNPKTFYGL